MLDNRSLLMDELFISWNHGQGAEVRFPVYAVSIDHPAARVLIDTGLDKVWGERKLPFETTEQSGEQTIPAPRAQSAVGPGNINIVRDSHLHLVWNNCAFQRHLPTDEELSSRCSRRSKVSTPA